MTGMSPRGGNYNDISKHNLLEKNLTLAKKENASLKIGLSKYYKCEEYFFCNNSHFYFMKYKICELCIVL